MMESIRSFLGLFDWSMLGYMGIRAAAVLFCIMVHEVCHGLLAYALGDPTAKNRGRLTFNPLRHISLLGFLMMLTVRVGWAKPVPIDLRYFRHPKWGMALTALAGPASNFVLALLALLIAAPLRGVLPEFLLLFFMETALLSIGLGLFNLIPIPPLDGSRVLAAFLPDRLYYGLMRYERYFMILIVVVMYMGFLSTQLSYALFTVLGNFCSLAGFPAALFVRYLNLGVL